MRLSEATLASVPDGIARFAYDRSAQSVGIVHIGIGAFHRAHQAWYTDRAMDQGDRDWAIMGVSLRSGTVAAQLNPQEGLYTVSERVPGGDRLRIVGSVRGVLVASQAKSDVIDLIAAPTTRIISLTITEKGYCRRADGSLDDSLADASSIYPLLAEGLAARRAAGVGGLTLLSCDNLADNGRQLVRLLKEFLAPRDAELENWITAECSFPSTMVDRIVPATEDKDRADVATRLGPKDEGAVVTEAFSQWVIEDAFVAGRPDWGAVGAEFVSDVAPYETAKLRMLNGGHSALAYLGLLRGHAYVHEAIADLEIGAVVTRLMRNEAATSFEPAPGQDLSHYADLLLKRFANAALPHRLAQIAMDGSQKIPQRWLATLADHQRRGENCPSILFALVGWIDFIRQSGGNLDDPRAEALFEACRSAPIDVAMTTLFGEGGLIESKWKPSPYDLKLAQSYSGGQPIGECPA